MKFVLPALATVLLTSLAHAAPTGVSTSGSHLQSPQSTLTTLVTLVDAHTQDSLAGNHILLKVQLLENNEVLKINDEEMDVSSLVAGTGKLKVRAEVVRKSEGQVFVFENELASLVEDLSPVGVVSAELSVKEEFADSLEFVDEIIMRSYTILANIEDSLISSTSLPVLHLKLAFDSTRGTWSVFSISPIPIAATTPDNDSSVRVPNLSFRESSSASSDHPPISPILHLPSTLKAKVPAFVEWLSTSLGLAPPSSPAPPYFPYRHDEWASESDSVASQANENSLASRLARPSSSRVPRRGPPRNHAVGPYRHRNRHHHREHATTGKKFACRLRRAFRSLAFALRQGLGASVVFVVVLLVKLVVSAAVILVVVERGREILRRRKEGIVRLREDDEEERLNCREEKKRLETVVEVEGEEEEHEQEEMK